MSSSASLLRSLSKPSNLRLLLPTSSSAFYSLSAPSRKVLLSARPAIPSSPLTTIPSQTRRMSSAAFLEAVKGRRSHYALSKDLSISSDRVQDIVKEALREVPSSFNSQSNRVVVLFGAEHDKFWDLVSETLKAIVPADSWEATAGRLAGFKAGAGSVLFFEDQTVVESFQSKFAIYADRFPGWATQSDAILQYTIWTALEAEGLGANLQHYNPLVDEKVAETWKVPATWKLNAQLVFGGRAGEAGPKEYLALEERYKVYGA
ncbi:nitroreductase family protein [Ophiostoma piceae UAMH 11346]|uniref:Nitroreductase family protein n=1 Tax=Ophiostoma piceae (strain UAMH 11346) TaxID=1262450 RepID=S3D8E6_OPHP1|nr:nitroreductase family protein [Ophiostoma piceae UAMH 11346]